MTRMNRVRATWAASLLGGTMVLSGCDPTVRDTVLGGVESASTGLVTALVQAFFESLTAQDEEVPTTVMRVIELPALG